LIQAETKFIARYAETDQMGIVHHSNYTVWFEAGRTDFLKKAGFSNTSIETKGVLLPLYGMNCQYKSPARYEDEIIVVTSLKQLSPVRMGFAYQVFNRKDNQLLATGETMHAWTDKHLKPLNAKKIVPDVYSKLNQAVGLEGNKA